MSTSWDPRHFILNAGRFDGTTPVTEAWKPSGDAPSSPYNYVEQDLLGRVSFARFLNPATQSMWVSVRCRKPPGVGDRVELRSVAEDETTDDPPPLASDQLLESRSLTQTWCFPFYAGVQDALAFHHIPDDGGTIDVQMLGVGQEAAIAWFKANAARCCGEGNGGEVESIDVEETSEIKPWAGELFVFVDVPGPGNGELTLPEAADVTENSRVHFVRVGGVVTIIQAAAGEIINGQLSPATALELSGFELITITRKGAGWVATAPTFRGPQTFDNAIVGGFVSLSPPTDRVTVIQLDFTGRGDCRLPPLNECPQDAEFHISRQPGGGTEQVRFVPTAGDLLNGQLNGVAYLGPNDAVRLRRTLVGWNIVGDGELRARLIRTVAVGNIALTAWGVGELLVRLVQAGAQTATLPARADVPDGAVVRIQALGAAKTVAGAAGENIIGNGTAAANTFALAANTTAVVVAMGPSGTGLEWSISI